MKRTFISMPPTNCMPSFTWLREPFQGCAARMQATMMPQEMARASPFQRMKSNLAFSKNEWVPTLRVFVSGWRSKTQSKMKWLM